LYILLEICDVISQRELNESETWEEYILKNDKDGKYVTLLYRDVSF